MMFVRVSYQTGGGEGKIDDDDNNNINDDNISKSRIPRSPLSLRRIPANSGTNQVLDIVMDFQVSIGF